MTLTNACISITDLKKNASGYIKGLKKDGKKVIFINNKPVAVLVDIETYESQNNDTRSFTFDPPLDPKVILDHFKKK